MIRKGSIWMVKENTQNDSWMWRKILKYRETAKLFYRLEVRNGEKTSFWYERWSSLEQLKDVVREGGSIDMGIPLNATVRESRSHRRRCHRQPILNRVEEEIEKYQVNWVQNEDISLWKNEKGKYKKAFSTRGTWLNIREEHQTCYWHKAIWFKHATPKYSFIAWVVIQGRLLTGDRMQLWNGNVDTSCVFCQEQMETLSHLFFECSYSRQIWENLMREVLKDKYTVEWRNLIRFSVGDSNI